MAFDDDGAEMMEMQAFKIAKNLTEYNGSAPCPQCGCVINPVEYMYNDGLCTDCKNDRTARRVKRKMT